MGCGHHRVQTHRADRFDVRLTVPADQGDEPRNLPGLDMPCPHIALLRSPYQVPAFREKQLFVALYIASQNCS
ncbi:hypothetical protein GCM10010911_46280 [Paenibacillus nasutitermitis]|uniref:Uncharacterized protein n=1 Tax=Paenibacillus nasutitermitis TaxID=1652958 RepID=A0A916Z9A8_9BACL|nr:hypothetical protein GCM10010911_46280 [Paenibacillus nasutitermitis]